ncbi:MAG TPA: hypothetical protein PLV83_01250, partial [Bacilli bacterium]|nr:hypothetical protein [Bacilli bacterium]
DIERRREELESSREIETLYDLTQPIPEDSKEIISKIEEANKLREDAQAKSEQAAKETNEEKIIALNSDADNLNEKAQILDKEIKKSRDIVINNTPIKQAITSAKISGQRLLNNIKLAAKSNEWVSSMPISKEEFTKLEDATKRLSVKSMGEVTSNSEVIPDILLIEEINAKYDAELKVLETSEIQEKETPLNSDLFPTQSTEELNITYARKKAEQIIEELPEDLLSSIENIEDAKLYLQNVILERLVKYTGKDISNITDKRSTKAIDKIVNEIKQEFFNLMEQERTIVEVESVPDSDITNVDVLSTEGIIEQVQQNTAILVESTEKILVNSKKNSNFVATEETILNVLKEIKNFKC